MPEQMEMFPDFGDNIEEFATLNEEAVERELEEMDKDFQRLTETWCTDV